MHDAFRAADLQRQHMGMPVPVAKVRQTRPLSIVKGPSVGLRSRGVWRGQLIKFYILSYFAYRFLTEFIRPEVRYEMYLTGFQWLILLLAPVFVFLWWLDAQQLKRRELVAS